MNADLAVLKREGLSSTRYKYQRLRERLRQAVLTGELMGKLPGERALALRYRANAKTINKALSDLTTEGLLVRHVGRGTFVADATPGAGHSPRKALRFLWMHAGSAGARKAELVYQMTESRVSAGGHRLDRVEHLVMDEGNTIAGRTLPPSATRDLDGVVIYGSRASIDLLADLHRRHIPTLLVNCRQDRIKTPMVSPDYTQGAFELCEQHIRLGHRDVRMIVDGAWEAATGQAEIGYQAAMTRHGLRAFPAITAGDDALGSTNGLLPAMVCIGAPPAIRMIEAAAQRGITMPRGLSISALSEPGDDALAAHSVTGYEYAADGIAHWAAELLLTASPGQLPRTVVVPGRLYDRGSAAPPMAECGPDNGSPREIVV